MNALYYVLGLELIGHKRKMRSEIFIQLIMLKKILNLKNVELLSDKQLRNITGGIEPRCIVFAPEGSSPSSYPFYPCAHNPGIVPTLCPDPNDDFAPPILC